MSITYTPNYAWVDTGVRFFRVTFKGGYYTARCGDIKGRAATLRSAVAIAAMRAHKARSDDPTPF